MTSSKPSVLITTEGGVSDYVTRGQVDVVNVDWDNIQAEHNAFNVRLVIADVRRLPDDMPWRDDVLQRLRRYAFQLENGEAK